VKGSFEVTVAAWFKTISALHGCDLAHDDLLANIDAGRPRTSADNQQNKSSMFDQHAHSCIEQF
jgi:hypothetical protein